LQKLGRFEVYTDSSCDNSVVDADDKRKNVNFGSLEIEIENKASNININNCDNVTINVKKNELNNSNNERKSGVIKEYIESNDDNNDKIKSINNSTIIRQDIKNIKYKDICDNNCNKKQEYNNLTFGNSEKNKNLKNIKHQLDNFNYAKIYNNFISIINQNNNIKQKE